MAEPNLATRRRQDNLSVVAFKAIVREISQVDFVKFILPERSLCEASAGLELELANSLVVHESGDLRLASLNSSFLTREFIQVKSALDLKRKELLVLLERGACIEEGIHTAKIERQLIVR